MPITSTADLLDGQLYYPGQLITLVGSQQAIVRTGKNAASTVLPFGFGVKRGSADGDLLLPTSDSDVFMGILTIMGIEKRAGYSLDASGRFGVPVGHEASYVEVGDIAVYVDGDVTEGGAVYWNVAASNSVPGAFRGAPNSTNTVQITGARWLKTVTGGTDTAMKVAPLRINRP
jgi:hypothetical protein